MGKKISGVKSSASKKPIEQYEHKDKKRAHIPPVGLVTPDTDPPTPTRKTYAYDPHLDPQLIWAGKTERTSFDIPTVSLHVHERIDPRTIINAVRTVSRDPKGSASGSASGSLPASASGRSLVSDSRLTGAQLPLFETGAENPPLRDAINFYDHKRPLGWKNRLIAGDSLLVMNSLLEKEGLGGQVQMVYLDPPYGIRYGSNFQPFTNKRDVKDGSDDDLTLEPETLKAFRDTWELGIHSYLTYLRDRLLLAKDLLHESGSCFVQIGDENLHHVRELMDEVFGKDNYVGTIVFQKTGSTDQALLPQTVDFILFYARDIARVKYRHLYQERTKGTLSLERYDLVLERDDSIRRLTTAEAETGVLATDGVRGRYTSMLSARPLGEGDLKQFELKGVAYKPSSGTFKTNANGMQKLAAAGRLRPSGTTLQYLRLVDDFPVVPMNDRWESVQIGTGLVYVVQTSTLVVQRCLLMTTDPGDLVLDPTCGSGTTAYVAEQWGRRWITTDTSRVAITLAKQRLMTATFDYYTLAHPEQGVGSGFKYKTVPHVTLKSIANNPEIREGMTREQIDKAIAKYADTETLYDQPEVDNKKARVTGPFTVEAVPAAAFGQPEVKPIDPVSRDPQGSASDGALTSDSPLTPDPSLARSGATLRQSEWRAELLKTGIRGKSKTMLEFVRVEALPGTRYLSADAETKEDPSAPLGTGKPRRAVISFGPEHAPLEQNQVAKALEEAQTLIPKPALVIFAALQFDPEASKDIDETNWPGVTMLKAQMNGDLVTEDLKKKRSSNESFWLVGQPDIVIRKAPVSRESMTSAGADAPLRVAANRYIVEVHGFDYYNPKSGKVESGGKANIAMWMLDPDYDGRSVYPRQVFFPMSGPKDGWSRLAKNLKAEIDEELIEQYRGTVSLPFEKGKHGRVAVKIVDDRGIESLRIVEIPV